MKLVFGVQYEAAIVLGWLEKLAGNETIADKLRDAGFVGVSVQGEGKTRKARGYWDRPTEEVDLPSQVSNVKPI